MLIFSDFIADLAERRSLRRTIDGGVVTYRMQLRGNSIITITTDETNPSSAARVCSEPWPAPASGSHGDFLRRALNFNRNALHHIPCGIVQDPEKPSYYRLIWRVPYVSLSRSEWTQQLLLFGKLTDRAWSTMSSSPGVAGRDEQTEQANHLIFIP